MNTFFTSEALKTLASSLTFVSLLPPVKRVRRRGFRRDVRRGDDVQFAGSTWCVVRRSPWNLWIEPISHKVGEVVTVRLPQRYVA